MARRATYPPVTGIIPAGGLSRRLGVDKTQLTLGRGKPLLAQVGRVLGSLCDELIVVGNRQRPEVLPEAIWLTDAYPGMGSLGERERFTRMDGGDRSGPGPAIPAASPRTTPCTFP